MNESDFELVEGSGNVFRDFGDPLADLRHAKAIIAARIIGVLDERELTVRRAADATGFAAADFSRIRNASLGRFTLDRLMKILAVLDGRIRVTVHVEPQRPETSAVPSQADVGSMVNPPTRPGSPTAHRKPPTTARSILGE